MVSGVPFDILTRITKFVKDDLVYAIIVAETAYATPSTDEEKKVKLIETKTDPSVTGPTGPVKATLLETSWNAGEDFATLVTEEFTGTVEEFTAERVYCVVVPKSEEALASWFEDYVVPITTEGANPTAPFLWRLDEMWITDPVVINFKIRNEPHIIGDDDDGLEPMVQMYPTSGSGLVQTGWRVYSYRTDKEGTEDIFKSPPEWEPDTINIFTVELKGLSFGKDPPLIAAEVPVEE